MDSILFLILAAFAVVSAVIMVTRRSPFISAVWLIGCLLSVAGIFALLSAPLLAVLQVLIAAGAVMILIVFVVMLVDLGKDSFKVRAVSFGRIIGMVAAAYLAFVLVIAIWKPPFIDAPSSGETYEAPATLSAMLLGRYAVPFELAGVLLLVAVVAAVALAKKAKRETSPK